MKINFEKIFTIKFIVIILSSIILVGLGFSIWQYITNKSLSIFSSDQWNFSFKYNPDKWSELIDKQKLSRSPDSDFAFIIPNSTQSLFTIKVSRKEGMEELDIDESIKDLDEKLPQRLKEFNKLESKEIEFQRVPGIDYKFRYAYQPIELLPKETGIQREIIFFEDEILYTLMFSALPSEFEKDVKEFEKILRTFKIK